MASRFTIIIPAYNGGEYFKECVRSVLAQTFNDFELAVLDDCSTDKSIDWLRRQNDARICIYSSEQRLGIVGNWARAAGIPKAPFTTILGQDDLLHPNYLQVMNKLIERHPDAGLYHAHFRFIDENGGFLRACRPLPEQESAAEYLTALFTNQRDTYGTGYLWRSQKYDALGGIPHFEKLLFADDALWFSLMSGSYKATAPEECFSCRIHLGSTSGSATWQSWMAAMNEYVPFLKNLAARDVELLRALSAHRDEYFLYWCRSLYTLALVQATRANKRIEPQTFEKMAAQVEALLPHLAEEFRRTSSLKSFRVREAINRVAPLRWTYNAYVELRYSRAVKRLWPASTR
ncbi:MAG TPA: glycosyltransferase family A protein [Abditibacteriaceae bacterium]|jgi:glycosyltransferase involved in cell wall biosynthesis